MRGPIFRAGQGIATPLPVTPPNDGVSFLPARHIKETGRDLPAIRFPVLAFRLNPIRGNLPS